MTECKCEKMDEDKRLVIILCQILRTRKESLIEEIKGMKEKIKQQEEFIDECVTYRG